MLGAELLILRLPPGEKCSVKLFFSRLNKTWENVFGNFKLLMTQQNARGRGRPRRADVYRQLAIQITELRERLGGLPTPVEAAGSWRDIWYEEAHHSTALEGNTLVLKQVERLLDEGRAVGNKELREYMEVRGYADAADWVYRQAISPNGFAHPDRC